MVLRPPCLRGPQGAQKRVLGGQLSSARARSVGVPGLCLEEDATSVPLSCPSWEAKASAAEGHPHVYPTSFVAAWAP